MLEKAFRRVINGRWPRNRLDTAWALGNAAHPRLPSQAVTNVQDGCQRFDMKVEHKELTGKAKIRLDAYIAERLGEHGSRTKVASCIADGLVTVNDQLVLKPATPIRPGDRISCTLQPPPPIEASPEDIPLDIVYEDDHLIVINKPAGMVVHLSAGHHSGTLVNALLHHCGLPALRLATSDVPPLSLDVSAAAPGSTDVSTIDALSAGVSSSSSISHFQTIASAAATCTAGGTPAKGISTAAALEDDVDCLYDDDDARPDDGKGMLWVAQQYSGGSKQGGNSSDSSDSSSYSATELCIAAAADRQAGSIEASTSSAASAGLAPEQQEGGAGRGHPQDMAIRPGIVHRLDKGTTGLLVVAKQEAALRRLCQQFKDRTTSRVYVSITLGCPRGTPRRVQTNIGRDPTHRQRMAALPYGSSGGKLAASNLAVLEPLEGAALVQWKLETGRTHQIRVHAKYLGHPLLGDETYGGGPTAAATAIAGGRPSRQQAARAIVAQLGRPALHALSLGFDHPVTGERMTFHKDPPMDFLTALQSLRAITGAC